MTKSEWRKSLKQAWADLVFAEPAIRSLNQNLQTVLQKSPGVWGLYRAAFSELPVCESQNGQFAYPRIQSFQDAEMSFWIPGPQGFERNAYGIEEPALTGAKEVAASGLTGLVIPALAFDRRGGRLGRGKGYYDRYLKGFQGRRVGVIPEQMLVDELPCEAHDQRIDVIVTEKQILHIAK